MRRVDPVRLRNDLPMTGSAQAEVLVPEWPRRDGGGDGRVEPWAEADERVAFFIGYVAELVRNPA